MFYQPQESRKLHSLLWQTPKATRKLMKRTTTTWCKFWLCLFLSCFCLILHLVGFGAALRQLQKARTRKSQFQTLAFEQGKVIENNCPAMEWIGISFKHSVYDRVQKPRNVLLQCPSSSACKKNPPKHSLHVKHFLFSMLNVWEWGTVRRNSNVQYVDKFNLNQVLREIIYSLLHR